MNAKLMIWASVALSALAQVFLKQGLSNFQRTLDTNRGILSLGLGVIRQGLVWLWGVCFLAATILWLLGSAEIGPFIRVSASSRWIRSGQHSFGAFLSRTGRPKPLGLCGSYFCGRNAYRGQLVKMESSNNLRGRRVAILGGGITGLTSAFYLLREGADVTVFESRPQLGGLATYFNFGKFSWDKFYHCILTSDQPLLQLIDDLGLTSGTTLDGDQGWFLRRPGPIPDDQQP